MFTEPVSDVRRETMIQELRTDLRQMQRGLRLEAREKHSVSTGIVPLDDILPEAFAIAREAAKRAISQRHYDVQLLGV